MNFDYKKYSLENLENWLHDAMSSGEATPQEIYKVIIGVVEDNYYTYKHQTSQAYELLALLRGNGQSYNDVLKEKEYYEPFLQCDVNDASPECKGAWSDFWQDNSYVEEYALREAEYYNSSSIELEPSQSNVDLEYVSGDKVKKWLLPVEVDGLTGECYINLPDDLLERANLKEGDQVEWIDNKDGSFVMKRVEK
jgi:hypothetical protein